MTPGARIAAAIDILSDILRGRPADRVVAAWSASNRYAGSKDRAAIQAHVYRVLRARGLLRHALGSDDARLLMLGALHLLDGLSPEEIERRSGDGKFAFGTPTATEREALRHAAQMPPPPLAARVNVPDWLLTEVEAHFGTALEAELAAFAERAPVDLRVNTLKTTREMVLTSLAEMGLEAEPTPISPVGIRLAPGSRITQADLYRNGRVDVQDEGSQIACLIADPAPGGQVVDLCAGGGGKTLGLAMMMANKGQLYACDVEKRRLNATWERAERAGLRNVQTIFLGPGGVAESRTALTALEGRMSCVMVDAPCSGTGTLRRNPERIWALEESELARYTALQAELLRLAADLVAPGGRLVYVTCSILAAENACQADAFLDATKGRFRRDPLPETVAGQVGDADIEGEARLSPASTGTDGYYIASFVRQA